MNINQETLASHPEINEETRRQARAFTLNNNLSTALRYNDLTKAANMLADSSQLLQFPEVRKKIICTLLSVKNCDKEVYVEFLANFLKIIEGKTLLDKLKYAIISGDVESARTLLQDVEVPQIEGISEVDDVSLAFYCFARWNLDTRKDMLKLLLEKKLSTDILRDEMLNWNLLLLFVLHFCDKTDSDTLEMCKMLLDHGVSVQEADRLGLTPFTFALMRIRDERLACFFVDEGFDVNTKLNTGDTCLHLAARLNIRGVDLIRKLLAKGAEVDAENMHGQTALHLARGKNKEDVVQLLLEFGAKDTPEPELVDTWGNDVETPERKKMREDSRIGSDPITKSFEHACQCEDPKCYSAKCTRAKEHVKHMRACEVPLNGNCSKCRMYLQVARNHAKTCELEEADRCVVPFCSQIKSTGDFKGSLDQTTLATASGSGGLALLQPMRRKLVIGVKRDVSDQTHRQEDKQG